ncbi:MAG: rRNA maturation RNase YbeY [Desulfobacteraceae bacterium]|nr:rRNA maturation RNase YbeY [Desulfobacteraceae bacterium]
MPTEIVRTKAEAVLNALDCPEGELSIVLADDTQIAELNTAYLNRTGPTNVIAFAMQEGEYADIEPNLLGDVVISLDTCEMEATDAGLQFEERFDQLLVHGILHLFGYDHIHSEQQAAEMKRKSNELTKLIS